MSYTDRSRSVQRGPDLRTIRFRTSLHNTIYDVLSNRNWQETDSDTEWEFFWADFGWIHQCFDQIRLSEYQRVNHFRNHYELTRKDLLIKNLKRMKKKLERDGRIKEAQKYNFYPETFTLPMDYALFLEQFRRGPGFFIMKPIGKAQGKGIFLFNKLSQISDWRRDFRWRADSPQAEPYIVQRYVENPFLIGGRKFDMRLYVLVTSYTPLTVWMYRGGFGRFTHARYSVNTENLENTYVHLTNVAVQKTSDTYDANLGCKWFLREIKTYMMSLFGEEKVNTCFQEIQDLIIRTLLAVQHVMIQDKHCFELYGYDVLIDDDLKPWLIEVNASPSLTAETEDDYELKFGLLHDTLTVVDMERRLTGDEEQIGGYDLIFHNGMVKSRAGSVFSTMLGCANNRIQQLKALDRQIEKRVGKDR